MAVRHRAGRLGADLVDWLHSKIGTVLDAQTAVAKTAAAVTTIQDKNASILSKAQAAACAGQAVANTMTDMLNATGHPDAAAKSAAVSAALRVHRP